MDGQTKDFVILLRSAVFSFPPLALPCRPLLSSSSSMSFPIATSSFSSVLYRLSASMSSRVLLLFSLLACPPLFHCTFPSYSSSFSLFLFLLFDTFYASRLSCPFSAFCYLLPCLYHSLISSVSVISTPNVCSHLFSDDRTIR